jgi:hypothetical protein
MFVLSFVKVGVGTALSADWLRPVALVERMSVLTGSVKSIGQLRTTRAPRGLLALTFDERRLWSARRTGWGGLRL